MPGIVASDPEEEEEDIEFVTAVTADEKRGKRQSEEFDMKTVSKKSRQDDGEPATVSTPPAPPVTSSLSSDLSSCINKDVSVKDKVTSKDVVSETNSEKGTSSETLQTKPTAATSATPSLHKKKSKLVCNFCKKTYQNYQGLSIHKSRMHKNEDPSEPDASQPENAEPENQSQNLSKDNLVCCGKKFPRLYNLKRHQKENCRISKSLKSSVVNSIPVNETLIDNDKEATIEELLATDEREEHENSEPTEEEINRRLFMDNVADGSDEDEEDDDLEIIDFVAGSTHKLSNEGVKSEPVESANTASESKISEPVEATNTESESKMMIQLIQQSKYFQDNPRMFGLCPAENIATFERELKSLKGWKVKQNQIKKPNGTIVPATHFLSPEGIIMRSGVAVLEYLKLGGWGEAEITAQAKKMKIKENNLQVYREKYLDAATA